MTDWNGTIKAGGGGLLPTSGRVGPIAEFRNRSSSAWLHFPHFELLFLFFAFEGVVTAAASILQYPGCSYAFYPALAALVSSIQRGGILLHTRHGLVRIQATGSLENITKRLAGGLRLPNPYVTEVAHD